MGKGHTKTVTAFLGTLSIVACSTSSNYAPVVYHDSARTDGRVVVSSGDPAATPQKAAQPAQQAASAKNSYYAPAPVRSEALGATVTSLPPPLSRSQPIEAEQPHSVAQPSLAYGVTSAERTVASGEPMTIVEQPPGRPAQVTRSASSGGEEPYGIIVQPGETLYSLSRLYQVDRSAIIAANNLQAPYELRTGQRLVIPKDLRAASAPPQPVALTHTVKPGETLYSIARTEHRGVHDIAVANNVSPSYGVKIGETLKLPPANTGTLVANAAPVTLVSHAEGGPLLHVGQSPVPPASAPVPPPVAHPANIPGTPHSDFIWPVSGKIISTYGPKDSGRRNDGVNISAPVGTPVRAARSGEVIYVGNELRGYGNLVLIRHDAGYVSAYAHNSKILVTRGSFVQQGQEIAESGDSGGVEVPQVHFEIRKDRRPIDPLGHLPKA